MAANFGTDGVPVQRRDPSSCQMGVVFSPVARRGQRPAVSDRWERSGVHHMEVDDLLPDLAVVCEVHVPAQRSSSLLANCAWLVVYLFSASASPRDAAL